MAGRRCPQCGAGIKGRYRPGDYTCSGCGATLRLEQSNPRGGRRDETEVSKAAGGPEGRKAAKLFEKFHGVKPTRAVKLRVGDLPKKAVVIGRLKAVEYEPYTEGERGGKVYRHEIGDTGNRDVDTEIYFVTDPDGKEFYLMKADPKGRYPYFDDRGMIG